MVQDLIDLADRHHHEQIPRHDDEVAEQEGLVVACTNAEPLEVQGDRHEHGTEASVEHAAFVPMLFECCLEATGETVFLEQRFHAAEGRVHVRWGVVNDRFDSKEIDVEVATELPGFTHFGGLFGAVLPCAHHHSPQRSEHSHHADEAKALAKNGRGQGVHHQAERHHGLGFRHRPHGQRAHLVDEPDYHEDRVNEHPNREPDCWKSISLASDVNEPESSESDHRNQHHHAHPGQRRDFGKLLLAEEDVLASGRGDEKQSVHVKPLFRLYQANFAWYCLNCKP